MYVCDRTMYKQHTQVINWVCVCDAWAKASQLRTCDYFVKVAGLPTLATHDHLYHLYFNMQASVHVACNFQQIIVQSTHTHVCAVKFIYLLVSRTY